MNFRLKATVIHFLFSLLIGLATYALIKVWYPHPYEEMTGGIELFFILISVDLISGPVMTSIIANPQKNRQKLKADILIIGVIQTAALVYGLMTIWEVRPLFSVIEVDRIKIINKSSLRGQSLSQIPEEIQPTMLSEPFFIGLKPIENNQEEYQLTMEVLAGGPDYGERVKYYKKYDEPARKSALEKSKSLSLFLKKYPKLEQEALELSQRANLPMSHLRYLPVMSYQTWIAVLDDKATVIGFLKGDGF